MPSQICFFSASLGSTKLLSQLSEIMENHNSKRNFYLEINRKLPPNKNTIFQPGFCLRNKFLSPKKSLSRKTFLSHTKVFVIETSFCQKETSLCHQYKFLSHKKFCCNKNFCQRNQFPLKKQISVMEISFCHKKVSITETRFCHRKKLLS